MKSKVVRELKQLGFGVKCTIQTRGRWKGINMNKKSIGGHGTTNEQMDKGMQVGMGDHGGNGNVISGLDIFINTSHIRSRKHSLVVPLLFTIQKSSQPSNL